MRGIDFFKVCRSVETFGNLTKSLCVHSLVIVVPQHPKGTLHLVLHEFLPPAKFFRVLQDLFLLVSHFALELSDLALEDLHFLGP